MSKLPVPKSRDAIANLTPIQRYLQEIAQYPLLDPEEEYDLAVQYFNSGDAASAHRLVTANLRLVVKIANDFRQAQIGLMDVIQEGNMGLMQAVMRFNPYKGVKLSSYAAWWIKAYILKYIVDNKSQVKLGTTAAQRKLFFNLKKEAEKLLLEYDHVDTKLLAERLSVKEKDVIEMQQRLQGPEYSLDSPISETSSVTRGEIIADETPRIDDLISDKQNQKIFHEHLAEFRTELSDRDRDFLDSRILAEKPKTLQEIGDKYGITRERARQLESRIIKKLRDFVSQKGALDIEFS